MNNRIARPLTLVSLAVLLFVGSAYGQYVQRVIKLTAPFEFTVDDKSFPPGQYSIVCLTPNRLDLRDSQNRVVALLITHSVQSRENVAATKLEFSTADGRYTLTQVWVANHRIGYELALPKVRALVAKGTVGSDHSNGAGNK
jgi:hypothetical protein